MKLFRNRENRTAFTLFLIICVVTDVIAFLLNVVFGIIATVSCFLLFLCFYITTYLRYKRIAALSADIDTVLHGDDTADFSGYSEGELAILRTEISKMLNTLREQKQDLANDKEFLADSIADISHQIRTPLTSINLIVSFLNDPGITEQRRKKLTQELLELLSKIDWLISALLKMSKLDAGAVIMKKENIGLSELINEATEPLLVPAELRDQTLEITASGSFCGDRSWSCEALTNIINNCSEHTPNGGIITITARETPIFSEIVITDNGEGISEEDLPHIFERFYKGKGKETGGFGIGLALARMIITWQNGTVKASNLTNGGASFSVRFYKSTV